MVFYILYTTINIRVQPIFDWEGTQASNNFSPVSRKHNTPLISKRLHLKRKKLAKQLYKFKIEEKIINETDQSEK